MTLLERTIRPMRLTDETPHAGDGSPSARVLLRVLASGSAGNCSVLVFECADGLRRACLLDLGLPPRRTFKLLDSMGIRPDQVDDALLTHLDHDHIHPGWAANGGQWLPRHARLHVHRAHARASRRLGLRELGALSEDDGAGSAGRFRVYDEAFPLHDGVTMHPHLMPHDQLGVVVFRFDIDGFGGQAGLSGVHGSLGYATDLGCTSRSLIEHLRGVNVLAIESNYCPERQHSSTRPAFLKRRIMNGSGHLSNQQALEAILAIEPTEHVVLLHLSRECNAPEDVLAMHAGADYALTISTQFEPTRYVRVSPAMGASRRVHPRPVVAARQLSLFGPAQRPGVRGSAPAVALVSSETVFAPAAPPSAAVAADTVA